MQSHYETRAGIHSQANRDTNSLLYSQAYYRGRRGEVLSALTRRSRRLLALDAALHNVKLHSTAQEPEAALMTRRVPIRSIRGSEGRAADFDCDFNPLHEHSRDRWLGIAAARRGGRALPPVALVQVGDCYFVRDGHHRISVARALGQEAIEATVEVWQVDGLPSGGQSRDPVTAVGLSESAGSLGIPRLSAPIRWRGLPPRDDPETQSPAAVTGTPGFGGQRSTDTKGPLHEDSFKAANGSWPASILGWFSSLLQPSARARVGQRAG